MHSRGGTNENHKKTSVGIALALAGYVRNRSETRYYYANFLGARLAWTQTRTPEVWDAHAVPCVTSSVKHLQAIIIDNKENHGFPLTRQMRKLHLSYAQYIYFSEGWWLKRHFDAWLMTWPVWSRAVHHHGDYSAVSWCFRTSERPALSFVWTNSRYSSHPSGVFHIHSTVPLPLLQSEHGRDTAEHRTDLFPLSAMYDSKEKIKKERTKISK